MAHGYGNEQLSVKDTAINFASYLDVELKNSKWIFFSYLTDENVIVGYTFQLKHYQPLKLHKRSEFLDTRENEVWNVEQGINNRRLSS